MHSSVIAAGKLADMLLIDGDPTQDIRDINKIKTVTKGGKAEEDWNHQSLSGGKT